MADFAKAEFALEVRQDDGHTLRDHLVAAWKASGEMPPELFNPWPDLTGHVWAYYVELHNRRSNYGFGHVPLTFIEIEAWKSSRRTRLDPWELDAILAIDTAYIASIAKKPAEGS